MYNSNLDGQMRTTATKDNKHKFKSKNNKFKSNNGYPVIDIISVGSKIRPDYQTAQKATFGKHPSVRNFFAIDEDDDVDKNCSANLEYDDVLAIMKFCGRDGLGHESEGKRNGVDEPALSRLLKHLYIRPPEMEQKTNPAGWLCAQKRPMAGFGKVMEEYRQSSKARTGTGKGMQPQHLDLPDYLVMMDDDTYFNMELVLQGLQKEDMAGGDNVESKNFVMAGCLLNARTKSLQVNFPYGGWGTIISKGALIALLQPLHCNDMNSAATTAQKHGSESDSDENNSKYYSSKWCPKIMKDHLGEKKLLRDGMSLADLVYQYTMRESYENYANWDDGYCLHSDWIWGYVAGDYSYRSEDRSLKHQNAVFEGERLRYYQGSETRFAKPRRREGQCNFDSDQKCTSTSHICHYVTPQHMEYLASSS